MNFKFVKLSYILEALKHEDYYWNIGFYALLVAGITHLLFIPLFFFLNIPVLALVNILSVAIYFYSIFYLGLDAIRSKNDKFIGWLVYGELLTHGILASYYLGLESGFHYYIYVLAFLPFFTFNYSVFIRTIRLIGIIATSILLNTYLNNYSPPVVINEQYLSFIGNLNLLVFLLIASGLSYLYTLSANAHQNNLLHYSTIDSLTELYNRRYLISIVKREMKQSVRVHKDISLLIIDIDYFKKINDTYGHTIGDSVIINLARTLKSTVRPENIVSRWGGEEFVILLPNCNAEELTIVATRLRLEIAQIVTLYNEEEISITVTIGGATLLKDESFDQFISRADKALYRGKEKGRNCYISA